MVAQCWHFVSRDPIRSSKPIASHFGDRALTNFEKHD